MAISWDVFSFTVTGMSGVGLLLYRRLRNRLDGVETDLDEESNARQQMEQDLYGNEYSDGGRTREYDQRLENIEARVAETQQEVEAVSRLVSFVAEQFDDVDESDIHFRDTHREQYDD